MTDAVAKKSTGYWTWQWAKIPLEFIACFVALSVAVGVGGNLLGKDAIQPLSIFFIAMQPVLIGRAIWNLVRLRKKGAPYFWAITLSSIWGFIMFGGFFAAIAIPNLSRFQAKARQSEAKMSLAALYGTEKAYFAEYNKYEPNLGAYDPAATAHHYMIGFSDACGSQPGSAGKKLASNPADLAETKEEQRLAIQDFFHKLPSCPDPATGFEAYAVGIIRPGGPLDVWRIDQARQLVNMQSGL